MSRLLWRGFRGTRLSPSFRKFVCTLYKTMNVLNIFENVGTLNILISYFILLLIDYIGINLILRQRFIELSSNVGFSIDIKWYGLIATYLLMLVGFLIFVDPNGSPIYAFLFGITTHGIYELTNYSTMKGWSRQFVLLDTLWGGALYTILFYLRRGGWGQLRP